MTSYSAGQEMGEHISKRVKANLGIEEKTPQKINRMT